MKVYHISQTLHCGDTLTPDHQGRSKLALPFVQALEASTDCFYSMVLSGKYLYALLEKFNLREWSDYAKWSTEGAFEFIRKTEFPECYSRLRCSYFYDNLADCKRLYEYDWSGESEEEQAKVHLFEIVLDDSAPQLRDMNLFDEAYCAMAERQDVQAVLQCAQRYFADERTEQPTLEILSDKPAKAVADITACLHGA